MKPKQAIKTLVPESIYTDRQEFIEYFYNSAKRAVKRLTRSTVLLGQRRMGKTEIFKRVVNKLFAEQDPQKIESVIPVYYSFKDKKLERWEFAIGYAENFLRWYTAFTLQKTEILQGSVLLPDLISYIQKHVTITPGLKIALTLMRGLLEKKVNIPEETALMLPRTFSDYEDITIAMFLDEFQNIHLPQHDFRIVGFMQEAVESPTCPHFVTGSAMSILSREILGKGTLYGRFFSKPIKPFTDYYGAELSTKAASSYTIDLSNEMAALVSERCGGNPFYINALIQQSAEQQKPIYSEHDLNKILAVDLSSGFIWAELNDQVSKWIDRLNDHNITKWILYLAALEEEDRIDLTRIQKELERREKTHVDIEKIKDVMIKLSRGDLIDYKEFGGWFTHINDPILNEFLKIWGKTEVAGLNRKHIENDIIKKYESYIKKYQNYQGYLAEVFMIQILWNNQRKTLDGKYFHHPEKISFPDRFVYINHRNRISAGPGMEIDIYAASGLDPWIAESKWWNTPVDASVVNNFIELGERVKEKEIADGGLNTLTMWLFASSGVSKKARELLEENNILWSTKDDLNALLALSGLSQLPDID
jgi:hypothetical protein